ncbi:MAG TPA: RagB/SusD family nutrient uptake outer membrane protein [Pricia sp.]|nr:RagB/SusD family nutrient uptake outer membrane protein [Pricia sp.]
MKNILKISGAIAAFALVALSCQDDFLETDPKAIQLDSNYYKNAEEVFNGVVAAYDPLAWEGARGSRYCTFASFVSASDEAYGGGGSISDVLFLNTMDDFSIDPANGPQQGFWERNFTGVSRTNTVLSKMEGDIEGLEEATRQRYIAEVKVLRAYYYFDLVRIFGNVPLFTEPLDNDEIYDVEQVPSAQVYAQIENDLLDAIAVPKLPDLVPRETEGGRMTKGTAHALLGKVYLYQGKWQEAAGQFAIVNGEPGGNNRFGYALLPDFGTIFRPDNKFSAESILERGHTSTAASAWGNSSLVEGFITTKMVGPRSYSGPYYYSGWGGCPLTPEFVDAIESDPRYTDTVINLDSLVAIGESDYIPGYEDTGYFIRKYAPLLEFEHKGAGPHPLNYTQNYVEIRLADTYLMEAEALIESGGDIARAGNLLNAVRDRVGLEPVTPTLENIYRERRLELATEGHRFSLRRRRSRRPGRRARTGNHRSPPCRRPPGTG